MSVLSVHELPQSGNDDNDDNVTAVRTFRVETSSKNDTWRTVRASSLLPQPGELFPGATYLIAMNRSGQQDDARRTRWTVTVNYGIPKAGDGSPSGGGGGEVEQEIPEYSVTSETIYEYKDKDLDEVPIRNSANEKFVPPLEVAVNVTVYTISRNMIAFDNGQAQEYRNTVNSDAFSIDATNAHFSFFTRTALLTRYDAVRRFRSDIGYYWRVTWEIKERADGWRKKFLDQGFMELDDSAEAPGGSGSQAVNKPIMAKNGLPLNGPVLLNGEGKPLANDADPVFLPLDGPGFKCYQEKDLSALPLSVTPIEYELPEDFSIFPPLPNFP